MTVIFVPQIVLTLIGDNTNIKLDIQFHLLWHQLTQKVFIVWVKLGTKLIPSYANQANDSFCRSIEVSLLLQSKTVCVCVLFCVCVYISMT